MKNRFLAVILAAVMLAAAAAGCTKKQDTNEPEPSAAPAGAAETTADAEKPDTSEPAAEPEADAGENAEQPEQSSGNEDNTSEDSPEGNPSEEIDYEAIYRPVLKSIYNSVMSGSENEIDAYVGIRELAWLGTDELLNTIGYTIADISGDGIPELIVGCIDAIPEGTRKCGNILLVYNCKDGEPQLLLQGWARNTFRLLEDGTIYNEASSGAAWTMVTIYDISEDGSELICRDCYFSEYTGEGENAEIAFYHNTSGEWDGAVSEALDVDWEGFGEIIEKIGADAKQLQLIRFSESSIIEADAVQADFAETVLDKYSEYDGFNADASEYQTKIAFIANEEVKDFRLLGLTINDDAENGKAVFKTEELYYREKLTPGRPLVVGMTFWGDIPGYGISYTAADGSTRYFSVSLSGRDGSVELSEF